MKCEPCNGTGIGHFYPAPGIACQEVPCWHCDGTGNAVGDQVMQPHNQSPAPSGQGKEKGK